MASRFNSCIVPDCKGNAHWEAKGARGWCSAHYWRWKRNGDPLAGRVTAGEPLRFLRDTVLSHTENVCLTWRYAKNSDGYGVVVVDGELKRVSRVVCEAVNGVAPSEKHEAAHSCGRGHEACCSPAHLSWATGRENSADKIDHGTANRGEQHIWAKLTVEQVVEVRALSGKMPRQEIADKFGISRRGVGMVLGGKSWAWLN